MREITWERMLELGKVDIAPLEFQFQLFDPTDEQGNICFRAKEVMAIQDEKVVVADADGGEWLAVSAKQVFVQAV